MRVVDLLLTRFNQESFNAKSLFVIKETEESKINKDLTNVNSVKPITEIHRNSKLYNSETQPALHIAIQSQTALNAFTFSNQQESKNAISMHEEQFSAPSKDDWNFAIDSEEDIRLDEERWWNMEEIRLFEEIEPLGSAFMTPPESPNKQPLTVFESSPVISKSCTTDSPEIKKLLLSKPHKNYEALSKTIHQTRAPPKRKGSHSTGLQLPKKPTITPPPIDGALQVHQHQPIKHSKDHDYCESKLPGLLYIDDSFIIKCLLNPNLNDEVKDETKVLRETSREVMSSLDDNKRENIKKNFQN